MGTEQAQQEIFRALLVHDGNRSKAAKDLNVSLRTFYRYLDEYQMHPILEKCGWQQHGGPPRGKQPKGTAIRAGIILHIRSNHGVLDYGKLAKEVYGQDTPGTRQRVFRVLDELKDEGRIKLDESSGIWSIAKV